MGCSCSSQNPKIVIPRPRQEEIESPPAPIINSPQESIENVGSLQKITGEDSDLMIINDSNLSGYLGGNSNYGSSDNENLQNDNRLKPEISSIGKDNYFSFYGSKVSSVIESGQRSKQSTIKQFGTEDQKSSAVFTFAKDNSIYTKNQLSNSELNMNGLIDQTFGKVEKDSSISGKQDSNVKQSNLRKGQTLSQHNSPDQRESPKINAVLQLPQEIGFLDGGVNFRKEKNKSKTSCFGDVSRRNIDS